VALNLAAGAEKIKSETPEGLTSRRLPETAPDVAPEALLKSGNAVGEFSPAAVRGSRLLNTLSGRGTRYLLDLWRSVRYRRKRLPSRRWDELDLSSKPPVKPLMAAFPALRPRHEGQYFARRAKETSSVRSISKHLQR
jgi:hypothetical protein